MEIWWKIIQDIVRWQKIEPPPHVRKLKGQFYVFIGSGCEFFSLSVLCLALPDAKVNNQSETTKCAMESGDGNTGEWPLAFLSFFLSFAGLTSGCAEFYLLIQQVSESLPRCSICAAQIWKTTTCLFILLTHFGKKSDGNFPKFLWAVLFVKLFFYPTE